MRVSHSNSNPIQGSEISSAKTGKAGAAKRPEHGDASRANVEVSDNGSARTEISARAKEMAQAKAAAHAAPETREEKIAELKRRILEGKYHVDHHAVADRLVDEHLKTGGMG